TSARIAPCIKPTQSPEDTPWRKRRHCRICMAKEKTLQDLFHDALKDIYFAEKKILTALPKMAKAANSDELRAAFEKHEGETEGRTARAGVPDQRRASEGQDLRRHHGPDRRGPGDHEGVQGHAGARRRPARGRAGVEHYEITRYGTLKTWAQELGLDQAVRLLDATLTEEKDTDEAPTEL